MATCQRCRRSSIFLKVGPEGYCRNCEKAIVQDAVAKYFAGDTSDLTPREVTNAELAPHGHFVIMTANDEWVCDACREAAKRTYTDSTLPPMPYAQCTSEGGCRCVTGFHLGKPTEVL